MWRISLLLLVVPAISCGSTSIVDHYAKGKYREVLNTCSELGRKSSADFEKKSVRAVRIGLRISIKAM